MNEQFYGQSIKDAKESLEYRVGALLYAPAVTGNFESKIFKNAYQGLSSIAFCLEDSIMENAREEAENILEHTFASIVALSEMEEYAAVKLPLLFIRVRDPEHARRIWARFKKYSLILTGFIFPKFDMSNCVQYVAELRAMNEDAKKPIFGMPILESKSIAYKESRMETLCSLFTCLDEVADFILNIRVGGNDFSQIFGLRRSITETIYEMGLIKDVLIDIVNVFGRRYVVSGPVWEYFDNNGSDTWRVGLIREMKQDLLHGFIGKTAIHPSQLPIINHCMGVPKNDYLDAKQVIGWERGVLAVGKNIEGNRMNELKCHYNWAVKTLKLAEIYGIYE